MPLRFVLQDENHVRVANALQTLIVLMRAIFKKKFSNFGFDVINLIAGFDSAEVCFKDIVQVHGGPPTPRALFPPSFVEPCRCSALTFLLALFPDSRSCALVSCLLHGFGRLRFVVAV